MFTINENKAEYLPEKQGTKTRESEVIAFIRFANNALTFKACLESIAPVIKKGILAYHKRVSYDKDYLVENFLDNDDGTLAIAQDFVKKNPGFKIVYYPEEVYPCFDEKYKELNRPWKNTLGAFYEYARLECLKLAKTKNPYLYKIDGDHIYSNKVIKEELSYLSKSKKLLDRFYLVKFNVHYCPYRDALYFIDFVNVEDHFIFLGEHTAFLNVKFEGKLVFEKEYISRPMAFFERLKHKDYCTAYRKFLKNPSIESPEDYQNKIKNGFQFYPVPQVPKITNNKVKNLLLKLLGLDITPKYHCKFGVSSLHFILSSRSYTNFQRGYKGFLPDEVVANFIPYKEFRESKEFAKLAEEYPDLNDELFTYQGVLETVKQFDFSYIKKYLDYYKAHPDLDYPED